jgi:energy-coupling factor transporter ATP-binding protein EcfA2
VNVEGTLKLGRQAAAAGVRRFVFVSSIKVNGEATLPGHPFSADDEPAPLDPYGVSKLEAEQKAGALLAQYNLLQLKDKATHELSDGQKQLLCILSVLLDGAELLLFDEPCSSLDRKTTEFIMQVIAGLPIPVMMATHDLRLLKDFDRIIWLESGAVLHDGNAQTLIAAYEAQ